MRRAALAQADVRTVAVRLCHSFTVGYGAAASDAVTLPTPLNPESPVSYESDTRPSAYRYAHTAGTDPSTPQGSYKCQLDTRVKEMISVSGLRHTVWDKSRYATEVTVAPLWH